MSDFEARVREMAADRLTEAMQFASGEQHDAGGSTSLLLSMAQTLRACMRDWPNVEDNEEGEKERLNAISEMKSKKKDARRVSRTSPLDNLVYVCFDAISLMAEQWTDVRESVTKSKEKKKEQSVTPQAANGEPSAKNPRLHSPIRQVPSTIHHFPQYQEEEISQNNLIDPMALFNTGLNGFIKEEDMTGGITDETDIWANQNPLAAFAAVTSSTQPSQLHEETGTEKRIRVARYNCPECTVSCVGRNQLEAHMNVHTGARPFGCEYCDRSYKRKDHLGDHLKKNHPAEYALKKQAKEAAKYRVS